MFAVAGERYDHATQLEKASWAHLSNGRNDSQTIAYFADVEEEKFRFSQLPEHVMACTAESARTRVLSLTTMQ
jgi:hypothetical protein